MQITITWQHLNFRILFAGYMFAVALHCFIANTFFFIKTEVLTTEKQIMQLSMPSNCLSMFALQCSNASTIDEF